MSNLHIRLLGAPTIELDHETVNIQRRKDLALLAYLAVTSQAHRRESLAALFWPEHDSSRAFSNLRRSIWELKQFVGEEFLVAERDSVVLLKAPEIWVDVAEFHSKVENPDSLDEAIDLYRGDFMTGFTLPDSPGFDDWQYFTRNELRYTLGTVLESKASELGKAGAFERAIPYAQRWLSLDSLNEAAHRLLMTLYAWSGERAAAIRQYQECVRLLQEELGLPPEEETLRLLERIQAGAVEKIQSGEEPMLASRSNLPIPSTPFVGRRPELDQLHDYLEDPGCRLLTLLGPGGVGKTRLALQVAEECLEKFLHGVYFVALTGLENPQAILPAIARALDFPISAEGESTQDQLLNYLRQKQLLLVLDNFEHLLGGAILIGEIITQTKDVKILVTSREKLGLHAESLYEVTGLRFPELRATPHSIQEQIEWLEKESEEFSAIQLFEQSARRSQSDFRLTPENLSPVVHTAQLVRGMPLALELAAAWVPLLSPEEIVVEIEQSLDFLETSMQDVPDRQRSMRAVFDHTWNLLNQREKEIFTQLAVFRGGFTRQAAHELFGISPVELREMVGKSLLARSTEGRFELHELLRQYAAEKLAQDPQLDQQAHDKHSAYFCSQMHGWGQTIHIMQKQAEMLGDMRKDFDNSLVAWNWALEHQQIERLDQASEALALFFWRLWRIAEGLSLLHSAREALSGFRAKQARHLYARILAWEGTFERSQRNYETADHLFRESLSILESPEIDQESTRADSALIHWGLGNSAFQIGEAKRSKMHYEISLRLYQETGKRYFEADVLQDLGSVSAYLDWDAKKAEQYWTTALEIKKSLGDWYRVAGVLEEMAIIAAYHVGDFEKAISLFQESSDIYKQFGDRISIASSLRCRAQIAHLTSRYTESHDLWQAQLPIFDELGARDNIAWVHTNLGLTQKSLGNYAQSEIHIREALKILERNPEEDIQKGIDRWCLGKILLVTDRLSEALATIEASLKIDRQMTGKHNLGRDLAALSLAEFLLGDKAAAWQHAQEAIELFLKFQHYDWMMYAASTLVVLLTDREEVERALTLFGSITCYPEAAASQWFYDAFWCHLHLAAASLSPDLTEEAIARGRQLDIWEYARELLTELNR